ncbi:hypothetical protein [Psychromonas sp. MME2]|uniref:hypothetical protein n=1 Tax=Psychromonas sp. MME2 TaxID=3231033 RepID=UPI00339B9E7D
MTDKKMGVSALALFSLCAVLVLDTLTASASIGVSSLAGGHLCWLYLLSPMG